MDNFNLLNKCYTLKRPKGSFHRLSSKKLHFLYLIYLYFIIPLVITLFSNAFGITPSPHVKAIQKDDFWLCLGEGQEKLEQSSLLPCWRQKGSGDIALLGSWPGAVSPAGKPQGSRLYALTALSKQLQESVLSLCLREKRGGKERGSSAKGRHAPAASVASQTKMRKQNGMLNEVCLPHIPSSVELLVLLCLKAKEEFAEMLSAMLQFLLPSSWLFAFAVAGNERGQS